MTLATPGLHHVTAIADDPQRNVDFYLRALGLRLVKTTVNFDAPDTYHLYYGDESGRPGTLLTFFPWRGVRPGRHGNGQATEVAFSVPAESLGWWQRHLRSAGVEVGDVAERDGENSLSLVDPDGLRISLVAHPRPDPRDPWDNGVIPPEHGIRGLHSVTLSAGSETGTAAMLEELGLRAVSGYRNRLRFAAGDGAAGTIADVLVDPTAPHGMVAGGTVHHVAWRAPDDEAQEAWRAELVQRGANVTPIIDRQYFRSIYFREPAGTLLELATEDPGFAYDEPLLELGRALKLPPWLEPDRDSIAAMLPKLTLPPENNPGLLEQAGKQLP